MSNIGEITSKYNSFLLTNAIELPAAATQELIERIHAEHAESDRSMRTGVAHAIAAGELLLQAKNEIGHGGWLGWLEENIKFSARLAQAYMRLAKLPDEKRNAVADLPLREALSAS